MAMIKMRVWYSSVILFWLYACQSGNQFPATTINTPGSPPYQVLQNDPESADRKILALLTYADRSYEWRKSALAIYQRLAEYQDSHDGKISSSDLRDMHGMANLYVSSIRQPLIDIMRSPYFYMDLEREIRFQNDRETYVERNVVFYQDSTGARSRDPSLQQTILNIHHINPHDPEGRAILKDFKVSLAASLLLLDNYAVALAPYFNNKSLRRSLFYDMPDTQWDVRNEVKNIWLNYENFHQSSRLVQAAAIYKEAQTAAALGGEATPPPGPYLQELDDLIQKSQSGFSHQRTTPQPETPHCRGDAPRHHCPRWTGSTAGIPPSRRHHQSSTPRSAQRRARTLP